MLKILKLLNQNKQEICPSLSKYGDEEGIVVEDKDMLKKVVNEISHIYDLTSKSNDGLKEVAVLILALKNLLIEKEIFTEEELIEKLKEY